MKTIFAFIQIACVIIGMAYSTANLASGSFAPVTLNRTSLASSYIEGKKIFKKGLNGNAELACKHCHKGTLKLKRSQLKKMGNNLAKNLRQAGGHDVFKGKVSEQQFNSIVSYMKKRYRIK